MGHPSRRPLRGLLRDTDVDCRRGVSWRDANEAGCDRAWRRGRGAAWRVCAHLVRAAVQDRIVQIAMTRQIAKAARAPYLSDDALHILLCGTGSPMPDMTRANACAAVIAGGQVVVIDAGPGAWSRIAAGQHPRRQDRT